MDRWQEIYPSFECFLFLSWYLFSFCLILAIIRLNDQFITNPSALNASPSTPLSFLCSLYVFIATTSDVINHPELQRLLVIVKDLSKTSNLYNLTRYSFVFLILFIQYAQTPIETNPTLAESVLLILKIGMMLNATAVMHSVHRIQSLYSSYNIGFMFFHPTLLQKT